MRSTGAHGLALIVVVAAAGGAAQPSRGIPLSSAPAGLKPEVERAEKAMATLQSRLLARLKEEMAAGGPSRAVAVCRDEAQAISAAVGREQRVKVGRTSHRLRNPKNGAPAWAAAHVAAGEGLEASAAGALVFALDNRVGVIKPIGTVEMCTRCHGAPEQIEPAVREALAKAYPGDRATGFKPGDLRGWIWAEVAPVR